MPFVNRSLLGALVALLMVAAGTFWWQGRAAVETGAPPPDLSSAAALNGQATDPGALPKADVSGMEGPEPPVARKATREERRFNRYDRDADGRITRNEMLATRTAAFRKLDVDGNNLLTFEEWAASTSDRFKKADANGDNWLSRKEFATTRPKRKPKPRCKC
ncbi:hypothetical protein RXV95_07525 [Novosphingobium sp. ZN18A2]|uniref:EF-hand domain-containing protein n=1 Tax=Novosphingobium sp. ZN18A2 TaxID=3079861 RepID=UPI0030CD94A7